MKKLLNVTVGLVLLVVWLVTPVRAAGNTYYVAPNGNDATNCTLTQPCATPERASRLMRAGDTLYFRDGNYYFTQEQSLTLSGLPTATITIASYPGEWAVLDGSSAALGDTSSILRLANSKYVVVRDLELQNSSGRGLSVYAATQGSTHHITVEGVLIENIGQRAFGGSGNDITLRNSIVISAAMEGRNYGGSGHAGGVASYKSGDGKPSLRWVYDDITIDGVLGECLITLDVISATVTNSSISNCFIGVYVDKAADVVIANNVFTQTTGWGKYGGLGDGIKLANESSPLAEPFILSGVTISGNEFHTVRDCFSYWHDGGNTTPENTYQDLNINGNSCEGNTGWLAYFYPVPSAFIQPTGNTFTRNTCTGTCNTSFGDSTDRAGWIVDAAATATPTRTATRTRTSTRTATWTSQPTSTATRSSTPLPSATSTSTASYTPSRTVTSSPTSTATATPSPSATRTPTNTRTPTATPTPLCIAPQHSYGVMIDADHPAGEFAICNLGASWLRPSTALFLDRWDGICLECNAARRMGMKVALTVRSNGGAGDPTDPITDTIWYSNTLASVLDTLMPDVLVVGNEEDGQLTTSTPTQYGLELTIGCHLAHERGLLCANGGLTFRTAALLTWDLLNRTPLTQTAAINPATDFRAQVSELDVFFLPDGRINPEGETRLARGWALLGEYRLAGIDYINFHWYGKKDKALSATIRALAFLADRPAITNEIGDRTGTSTPVGEALLVTAAQHMPIVIWYTPLQDNGAAYSLVNPNGTLRPTGMVYRDFILGLGD